MPKIIVNIQTQDKPEGLEGPNRALGLMVAIELLCGLLPETTSVVFEEDDTEDPGEPSYVVQVDDQYTYICDIQPRVRVRDLVDIESRNGGRWQGKVTRIFEADDYSEDHDLPSLKILGLF